MNQTANDAASPAPRPALRPPEHLLVCVDVLDASGCDFAHALVEHAAVYARALHARITLIAVLPPLTTPATPPIGTETAAYRALVDVAMAEHDACRRVVQTLVERLRGQGLTCESRVVEHDGDAAKTIAATAADVAADLVVIASHSRRGLAHAVLGSVAERTVRQSPVPVVVVPRSALLR